MEPEKSPMPQPVRPTAKVRQLSIRNHKGIKNLELELPGPRMRDDPDAFLDEAGLGRQLELVESP